MTPMLEALTDLDPLRTAHTCPRCRELWAYRESQVRSALLVRTICPNGHKGAVYLPDLPDRVLVSV